jgi:hypothetical protein
VDAPADELEFLVDARDAGLSGESVSGASTAVVSAMSAARWFRRAGRRNSRRSADPEQWLAARASLATLPLLHIVAHERLVLIIADRAIFASKGENDCYYAVVNLVIVAGERGDRVPDGDGVFVAADRRFVDEGSRIPR